MESLALLVSAMFFGSILLALASIVLGVLARKRPALQPFAWAVAGGATVVGAWFATMSWPLAAAPLIGGAIGVLLLGLQLLQKR